MNTKYMFGTPECVEITEKFDGNGEQHVGVLKNFVAAADCDGRLDFSAEEGYNSVCLANAMLLNMNRQGWNLRGATIGDKTMHLYEKDSRYTVLYFYDQTTTAAMEIWVLTRSRPLGTTG